MSFLIAFGLQMFIIYHEIISKKELEEQIFPGNVLFYIYWLFGLFFSYNKLKNLKFPMFYLTISSFMRIIPFYFIKSKVNLFQIIKDYADIFLIMTIILLFYLILPFNNKTKDNELEKSIYVSEILNLIWNYIQICLIWKVFLYLPLDKSNKEENLINSTFFYESITQFSFIFLSKSFDNLIVNMQSKGGYKKSLIDNIKGIMIFTLIKVVFLMSKYEKTKGKLNGFIDYHLVEPYNIILKNALNISEEKKFKVFSLLMISLI